MGELSEPEINGAVLESAFKKIKYFPGTPKQKIGIFSCLPTDDRRANSFTKACEDMDIKYQLIDAHSVNWIEEVKRAKCDGILVYNHPAPFNNVFVDMFDERIKILDDMGYKLWPKFNELYIQVAKRKLAYYYKIHDIPHPKTYIFYRSRYEEARDFLLRTDYPIIYKPHIGQAANGVKIIRNYKEGIALLDKLFRKKIIRAYGDKRFFDYDVVLFQEYLQDIREYRVMKIGRYWFGYEKLKSETGMFHSGSGALSRNPPATRVFDFCKKIADDHYLAVVSMDIFQTIDDCLLVNEIHPWFGSTVPPYLYIDNKAGAFKYQNDSWVFEEGFFNLNWNANLIISEFLYYLQENKD